MTEPRSKADPGPPASSASGKGMPAKSPRPQRARPGTPDTLEDGAVESSLELPHERDQAVDMTSGKSSPRVEQAARDVARGRQDTSKGPEMDRAYQKQKSPRKS